MYTVPSAGDTGAARKLVLTAAGPTMGRVLHELSLPTFHSFAAAWGYDVRAVDLPLDGSGADPGAQWAKWSKLSLLREALEDYALVLWLDADVLVLRTDEDVADHLRPGDMQAMALEQVPAERRLNPNTGVWLLHRDGGPAFLDAVLSLGPQPGPWADQGAVLVALGWDRGDLRYRWARPGCGSPFLSRTSWLPPGWNQPFVHGRGAADCFNSDVGSYLDRPVVDRPHAVHFMGLNPQARFRLMSQVAPLVG